MNDRELLELAAKAAGLNGYVYEWVRGPYFIVPADPDVPRSEPKTYDWLNDDGDALRLAVKLRLDLHFEMQYLQGEEIAIAEVMFGLTDDGRCNCLMHSLDDDPAASVRRLITRAAAEIARAADAGGKEGKP